jgi:hypothetical protein
MINKIKNYFNRFLIYLFFINIFSFLYFPLSFANNIKIIDLKINNLEHNVLIEFEIIYSECLNLWKSQAQNASLAIKKTEENNILPPEFFNNFKICVDGGLNYVIEDYITYFKNRSFPADEKGKTDIDYQLKSANKSEQKLNYIKGELMKVFGIGKNNDEIKKKFDEIINNNQKIIAQKIEALGLFPDVECPRASVGGIEKLDSQVSRILAVEEIDKNDSDDDY